jgi:predicted ATPase with chaperone activity
LRGRHPRLKQFCGNETLSLLVRGTSNKTVRVRGDEIQRYRPRLSGPLLDRIDVHLTLGATLAKGLRTALDRTSSKKS